MQRQQTLADLLADDTGNLRPEVADLLMERPRQQRVAPIIQRAARREITIRGWVLALVALGFLVTIFFALPSEDERQRETAPVPRQNIFQADRQAANMVNLTKAKGFAYNIDVRQSPSPETSKVIHARQQEASPLVSFFDEHERQKEPGPATEQDAIQDGNHEGNTPNLGRARVFGFNVNVRRSPSLQSPVIRKTNQSDTFPVLSFSDGWYEVLLENDKCGYIFGAYLLPMNFQIASHMVGIARDRTKLLLAPSRYQGRYQVILPSGERHYIRESDVRVLR